MSHYSHHSGNGIAEGLGGGIAIIAIALLLLAIYITVKCINLVFRVIAAHPENKVPWILLGCFVLFGLLSLGTRGEPIAMLLCGISLLVLIVTCRILELYYDNRFQKEGTP